MSDYFASTNHPPTVKGVAEAHGFCLVKEVFSADEMIALERDLAMAHAEFGGRMPDLYSVPSLQWLLYDERVRRLAHALLGDTLVYYRETNLAYEKTPGPLTEKPFDDYHCDARGTPAALFGPPSSNMRIYPAYRFAIYFRNYREHSGGLKVAPGSHLRSYDIDRRFNSEAKVAGLPVVPVLIGGFSLNVPLQPMELHNVPAEPGDLVIFSLRCFHAAGALRFKDRPTLAVLPHVERAIRHKANRVCCPVPPGPRNAIFFDFGAPSPELDYYIKWRAYVGPADLNAAFSYRDLPPSDLLIRNDRIIVPLAKRVADAAVSADADTPSARQDRKDLYALGRAHAEFAPEHMLFDRDAFLAAASQGPAVATVVLARDILARREAQFEAEKRRLATG